MDATSLSMCLWAMATFKLKPSTAWMDSWLAAAQVQALGQVQALTLGQAGSQGQAQGQMQAGPQAQVQSVSAAQMVVQVPAETSASPGGFLMPDIAYSTWALADLGACLANTWVAGGVGAPCVGGISVAFVNPSGRGLYQNGSHISCRALPAEKSESGVVVVGSSFCSRLFVFICYCSFRTFEWQ